MAQKENQRIALTKKLLQEGLLRLLEQKTLDRISVTELCRESGINRATFYNHYNSPQDLLNNIEDKIAHELRVIIGKPRNPDEVSKHVEAICKFFYENSYTILTLHNCHADPKIVTALYDMNTTFQAFRIKERYTQNVSADAIHLIAVFFNTGCYNILLEWLRKEIPATPAQIAELMVILASENFIE